MPITRPVSHHSSRFRRPWPFAIGHLPPPPTLPPRRRPLQAVTPPVCRIPPPPSLPITSPVSYLALPYRLRRAIPRGMRLASQHLPKEHTTPLPTINRPLACLEHGTTHHPPDRRKACLLSHISCLEPLARHLDPRFHGLTLAYRTPASACPRDSSLPSPAPPLGRCHFSETKHGR